MLVHRVAGPDDEVLVGIGDAQLGRGDVTEDGAHEGHRRHPGSFAGDRPAAIHQEHLARDGATLG